MVWLMTAFYKRNFINLKAAHLHLNPCVETAQLFLISFKSWCQPGAGSMPTEG